MGVKRMEEGGSSKIILKTNKKISQTNFPFLKLTLSYYIRSDENEKHNRINKSKKIPGS
jgi:hypothetical protein